MVLPDAVMCCMLLPSCWYAVGVHSLLLAQSGFHLEPTMAAAQRKIHVLCDKPLEITLEGCDQMRAACDEAGVQLRCLYERI